MTACLILVLLGVAVAYVVSAYRHKHVSLQRRGEALQNGQSALIELRSNNYDQGYKDWELEIGEVFDLRFVTLADLGTTEEEMKRLLVRSAARKEVGWLAHHLQTFVSLGFDVDRSFDGKLKDLEEYLILAEMTLEELGINDLDALRREAFIRNARANAQYMLKHLDFARDFADEVRDSLGKSGIKGEQVKPHISAALEILKRA